MWIPLLLAGGVVAYIWTKRDTRIPSPTTGRLPPRTGQFVTDFEPRTDPLGRPQQMPDLLPASTELDENMFGSTPMFSNTVVPGTSTDPAVAQLEQAIQGGQSARIIRNLRSQIDPRLVSRYRPVVIDRQKLHGGLFIPDRILPRRYIHAWTIGMQAPMSPTDARIGVPIVRYFDSHTFSLDKAPTDVVRYFNAEAGIRPVVEFVPVDTIIASSVPFPEPVRTSAGGGRRVPMTAGVGQTRRRVLCDQPGGGCPVRSGLGETARIVGTVPFGEEVEAVRRTGPFTYVNYPKGLATQFSGWVPTSTLHEERIVRSTLASCVYAACPTRVFRGQYVHYASLKRGERVTIYEAPPAGRSVPAGRLYFTKPDGTEGYVEKKYVRPVR